jgi:methylmalonyl-CoA mutase N-terminal domain/subunit
VLWFVEALTNGRARRVARTSMRSTGWAAWCGHRGGLPTAGVADAAYRYQREFDAGEREVVGVNVNVDPDEMLEIRCCRSAMRRSARTSAAWSASVGSATGRPWRCPRCVSAFRPGLGRVTRT